MPERTRLRDTEGLVRMKERDIDTLSIRREAFGLCGAMSRPGPSVVDVIEEKNDDEEENVREPADPRPDPDPEGGAPRTSGRGTTGQAQRSITVHPDAAA